VVERQFLKCAIVAFAAVGCVFFFKLLWFANFQRDPISPSAMPSHGIADFFAQSKPLPLIVSPGFTKTEGACLG